MIAVFFGKRLALRRRRSPRVWRLNGEAAWSARPCRKSELNGLRLPDVIAVPFLMQRALSPPWNYLDKDAADGDDNAKRQQEGAHAKPFSLSTPSILKGAGRARLTLNC
jgi:hypothetical protein